MYVHVYTYNLYIYVKIQRDEQNVYSYIKTHDSESRGQEEAAYATTE